MNIKKDSYNLRLHRYRVNKIPTHIRGICFGGINIKSQITANILFDTILKFSKFCQGKKEKGYYGSDCILAAYLQNQQRFFAYSLSQSYKIN